ncbi:MAG TPA: hypothetical protein VGG75_35010 [Trebonia sp.]
MAVVPEAAVRIRELLREALLHLGIRDVTAGYKIWRTSALQAIDLSSVKSAGYSFQVEMNYRASLRGFKIVELPIHFSDRTEGESKMNLKVQRDLSWFRLGIPEADKPRYYLPGVACEHRFGHPSRGSTLRR